MPRAELGNIKIYRYQDTRLYIVLDFRYVDKYQYKKNMHRENESCALLHNLYKKYLVKVYKPN